MELDVRYTTTRDRVPIAYTIVGDGPGIPAVGSFGTCAPPMQVAKLAPPVWWHSERFNGERAFVRFDFRNTGLSGSSPSPMTNEQLAMDFEAVVEALGAPCVDIMAWSGALVPACLLAVRIPERIRTLTIAGMGLKTTHPEWQLRLLQEDYFQALRFQLQSNAFTDDELLDRTTRAFERAITRESYLELLHLADAPGLEDVAPRISVPVLGLQVDGADEGVAEIVRLIPDARLRTIPAGYLSGEICVVMADVILAFSDGPHERADARPAGFSQSELKLVRDEPSPDGELTSREQEVLRLLARGQTNAEIAQSLVISVHTVNRHVSNIYDKTGMRNRAQAAGWALKRLA